MHCTVVSLSHSVAHSTFCRYLCVLNYGRNRMQTSAKQRYFVCSAHHSRHLVYKI